MTPLERAKELRAESLKHLPGQHDQSTHGGKRGGTVPAEWKKKVISEGKRRYGFTSETIKRIFPNDEAYKKMYDNGMSPEDALKKAMRDWV